MHITTGYALKNPVKKEKGKNKKKIHFCVGYLRPMFFSVSLFYANRVIPRANVEKKKNSIQV